MKGWALVTLLLLAGCVATESEERLQPTPTSTQNMELTGAAVRQAADGTYYIPDQGDGCGEFKHWGPMPTPIVTSDGTTLPVRVTLISEACPLLGWDYDIATGELFPLAIEPPQPR